MPDKHYILWTSDPEKYEDYDNSPELLCASFSKDYIEEIQAYRDKHGFHSYFIEEVQDIKSDLFEELKKSNKAVYYGTCYNNEVHAHKIDPAFAIVLDMRGSLHLNEIHEVKRNPECGIELWMYFLAYDDYDAKKTAKDMFETYLEEVEHHEL